jgi:heat shock protein 90kDa beta
MINLMIWIRDMECHTLGDTSSLEFMRGRKIFEINPDHPIVKDKDLNVKSIPDPSQFINH